MIAKWIRQAKSLNDGSRDLACPECGHVPLSYRYIGNLQTRIGSLVMWCDACHYGVNVSRVKIPVGAEIISDATTPSEMGAVLRTIKFVE